MSTGYFQKDFRFFIQQCFIYRHSPLGAEIKPRTVSTTRLYSRLSITLKLARSHLISFQSFGILVPRFMLYMTPKIKVCFWPVLYLWCKLPYIWGNGCQFFQKDCLRENCFWFGLQFKSVALLYYYDMLSKTEYAEKNFPLKNW